MLPDSLKTDVVRLVISVGAVGGIVSTGHAVLLGMLTVVCGRDVGSGVGQPWVVLLGARGRPLLGDGSALLRTCLGVVRDADAGEAPGATISAKRGMLGAGDWTGSSPSGLF